MKAREVIDAFIRKEIAAGSNCHCTGDKMYSFNTVIAQWKGNTLIINETKYSVTTTKLTNYCKAIGEGLIIKYVNNVPTNTQNLIDYLQ